jgi:hypothetical protein
MVMGISNSADVIDSRDIEERIDELAVTKEALEKEVHEAEVALAYVQLNMEGEEKEENIQDDLDTAKEALKEWEDDVDEGVEYETLLAFKRDVGSSEWDSGVTLVRETYWVDYVEEMVKDIGDMPSKIPDYIVIDWDATADNVKQDFSIADYDGVTYYYRDA